MPAKAGIFLAFAGTTLWFCSMPRRQKMPVFAGMTAYSRASPADDGGFARVSASKRLGMGPARRDLLLERQIQKLR
jgi:hypothetical protein